MILHITNDYSGSTVYMNLVRELDNLGIPQIVYNPVREQNRVGKNSIIFKTEDSKIIYRPILNYHIDRYFYPWKILKILWDIQKQIDFTQIDFIHAHTWYSDGGVAYQLSKKYNIPFMVAIRNTDLNLFQERLKYLHPFGRKILVAANKIILISVSYRERVLEQESLKSIKAVLKEKIKILPNGVDPFWIENVTTKPSAPKPIMKLLYIGNFNSGKNVLNLIKAVISLNSGEKKCELDIVGGGGLQESEILKLIDQYPHLFNYHGKIYDKNELKDIFASCDIFAMPSRSETFGLVYVEAMTQGLPILYTENEGIDGFYDEPIGEKVSKGADENEIQKAILKMIDNYESYQIPIKKIVNNHNWKNIASTYNKIYNYPS